MLTQLLADTQLPPITTGGGALSVDPNTTAENLGRLVNTFISFGIIGLLTALGALFFLIQIFLAALAWIGAGGNENNITAARQKIINSILGLAVLTLGYALVAIVSGIIGIHVFNPLEIFTSQHTPVTQIQCNTACSTAYPSFPHGSCENSPSTRNVAQCVSGQYCNCN